MPSIDDAFTATQSLTTDEKLELISRLWQAIAPTYRPSDNVLAEVTRRVAEFDAGKVKSIPWEEVSREINRKLAGDR